MRKRNVLGLFLALVLGAALVTATLVPRLSLEQILDDSELIVHGTVVRSWADWDRARQFIWTHYELRVADTIKGLPSVKIVVSEPGGVIGETGMQIAGAPRYSIGEEVVLFLNRTPIGYLRTCGWGQGRFNIQSREQTGLKVVHAAATGVELIDVPGQAASPLKQPQTSVRSLDGLSLDELKTRLRTLVRDRAAEGGR